MRKIRNLQDRGAVEALQNTCSLLNVVTALEIRLETVARVPPSACRMAPRYLALEDVGTVVPSMNAIGMCTEVARCSHFFKLSLKLYSRASAWIDCSKFCTYAAVRAMRSVSSA